MIENGLLGKVVKTNNYHFIGFLYPNFPFVGHFLINYESAPGIIYSGKEHLIGDERKYITSFLSKEKLQNTGYTFISIYSADGKYDIDLTDRETMLDLVYSKWGFDYKQYLDIDMLAVLLERDEQDFYDFLKFRWLSKKRCANSKNIGLYTSKHISKLLNKPIESVYAEILSLEKDKSLEDYELSLTIFIMKSMAGKYSDEKDDYNAMLKTFDYGTRGKENELAVILSKYRNMSHNKRIKLIWLITELQKLIKEK